MRHEMAASLRALCPVLVGRESELSALEDALLKALRGDGSVVVVGGEAGLGKTRLTAELIHRARSLGAPVLSGACSEAEISLPYLSFLEAIGNHLGDLDLEAVRSELGGAVQELAQLFPQLGSGQAQAGDAVQSKLRLFESILLLLRHVAGPAGLLLVLEDLHWADPATRELLDYMTRRLRSTKVLIVATYRTEELHRKHALLPTIQGWRRSGQVEVVEVGPLPESSIGDMLCAIFDQEEVSLEFQQFVLARTEGNPFVVEEMLKEAIDRGDIFRTAEGWDRKEVRDLRLPPSVRDGILLRVERLDEVDGQVLSAAAVVGRSFDVGLLTATTRLPEEEVVSSLQRCVLHQLLEEDAHASATYRFRHALTQEAVYEDMVTPRRQQLHGRVVDILIERDRPPTELANHLLLAGRGPEAVVMCERAALEASRTIAYRDAAELLERALPLALTDAERGRLLCLAAEARWNNVQPGIARKLLVEGIPLLESAGEAAAAAAQRLLLGRCHWELQRSDLARQEFEFALATLEPMGPSEALATAYVRLAGLATFNSRWEEALELCERAVEIAQSAGAERPLAWAWIFGAGALVSAGRWQEALDQAKRGFELALQRGFWFQAGNAVFNMTWMSVHLGRGAEARFWLAKASADLPEGLVVSWLGYLEGLTGVHSGRLEAGLESVRAAQQVSEETGQEKNAWRCRVVHAHILAELDRGAEAAEILPPLSSRVDTQDAIYDTTARIRTALALRDPAGAVEAARNANLSASQFGSPADAAAQATIALEPDFIRAAVAELPVLGDTLGFPRYLTALGAAELAGGDAVKAITTLGRAVESFRREGFLLDSWHASLLLARAEVAGGRSEAAQARLVALSSEAGAAGAALAVRLALELALELGLQPATPAVTAAATATAPVAESPRFTGERLVTVLFADIRGYTARSSVTPPVDLVDALSALHRWASEEVRRNHGVVDKFAGDAVMATFNASGATVDHARHAIDCALALIEKAALAGLAIGCGVATGAAVVGRLTEGGNLSVIGQATNLAARLQAQSGPGEVTVSEETQRRLGASSGLGAGELIELDLKGIEGPVKAYRFRARRRD